MSKAVTSATAPTERRQIPVAVIVIYLCAMAINGFDGTVVAPVLPAIAHDLSVSPESLGSIEWSFLFAAAVVLPAAAWLTHWQGTSRIFCWCLAGLSIGLVLSACAPNPALLVAARLVQGASSGILVPVGLALMYKDATGEDRLRIARWTLVPLTIAPMLGPVVGGVVAEHWGWRWIFGALALLSMCTWAAAYTLLPRKRTIDSGVRGHLDIVGLFLLATGTGALTLVAPLMGESIQIHGIVSWRFAVLIAVAGAGVIALIACVRRSLTSEFPVLSLEVFRSPLYRFSVLSISTASLALSGFLFFLPLMLSAQGHSLQSIGVTMFPETLGLLLGSQMMMHLNKKFGSRCTMLGGLMVALGALIPILLMQLPLVAVGLLLLVFGVGLSQPVLLGQAAAFNDIAPEQTEDATTLFIVIRTVLSAWGVVLVMSLIHAEPNRWGSEPSYSVACALGLLIVGAGVCLLALPAHRWQEATSTEPPQEQE